MSSRRRFVSKCSRGIAKPSRRSGCSSSRRARRQPCSSVAEPAGDPERWRVVVPRAGHGELGTEAREPQRERRDPHLGSDPLPLMSTPEPRSRLELAQPGEVRCAEAGRADHRTVDDHAEVDVPRRRRHLGAAPPVELQGAALERRGRGARPRHGERHRSRVVDAACGQGGQLHRDLVGDRAQRQARRPHLEVEERPVRVRHGHHVSRPTYPHPDGFQPRRARLVP
jgi:hypothetical protein